MARWLRSSRVNWVAALMVLAICRAAGQTPVPPATSDAQVTRTVGTIKSTLSDSLVVTPDSGGEVSAKLSSATKILCVPPGEKDLKNATPLQAQDLQPGDRVLVRGQASADGHGMAALAVIVMRQGDVSAKQEHERDDWHKRGVGGLVTAADAPAGTITISSLGLAGNRHIRIHTPKNTTPPRDAHRSG